MVGMVRDGLLAKADQQPIAAMLGSERQRGVLLGCHTAYLAFYGDWLGESQPLPWWERRLEIHGQRLHLAGLDSAWMAGSDHDRGRLLLGRYQLARTLLPPHGEDADWRLALLLLDGLDEVPVSQPRDGETLFPRDLLLSGLADALPHWEAAGNCTLLASRPHGLDKAGLARLGLPRAPLRWSRFPSRCNGSSSPAGSIPWTNTSWPTG